MAGKTLTGIGEDESGRHELGTDTSDPAIGPKTFETPVEKPPSTRPTDRMPMYLPSSNTPGTPNMSTLRPGAIPSVSSTPTIDDDKVAEGLKKLRSLDEPLGPIPTPSSPAAAAGTQPGRPLLPPPRPGRRSTRC